MRWFCLTLLFLLSFLELLRVRLLVMIHYDTFVEDNWVVSMVWGEKNSVVEALLLQCWLQEMAPAQCLLFPQGFCCAFSMTGIREIWSSDNRLYGFIIHSQRHHPKSR